MKAATAQPYVSLTRPNSDRPMSVLLEAISVIARIDSIQAKYPGGLSAYRAECPNRTLCADEHLVRIGFMTPDDVGQFVRRLRLVGLVHLHDGRAVDLVVVDQHRGPTSACEWIDGGKHPDGYSAAWKAGTVPGWFAVPVGWAPQQSVDMTFVDTEAVAERMLPLKRDDGVEVVLDYETGREKFIGRVDRGPSDN